MYSDHKIKSPHFKDNVFITMRETVCIITKSNLHRLDLCCTQHASLKGKRAPRFITMYSESSKVQGIIKEVRGNPKLIVSFSNAVNILKHLEAFWRNDKQDGGRGREEGVTNSVEYI